MRGCQQDEQKPAPLSAKLTRLVQWLVMEAAPIVDADACNWKLVINGGQGKEIKTVIEQHKIIKKD